MITSISMTTAPGYTTQANRIKPSATTNKNISQNASQDTLETNNPKLNRQKALKDGSLIYHKEKEIKIFGRKIQIKEAKYEYKASGNETIRYIKIKFGIKDGEIRKLNPHIRDDNFMPSKGYSIFLNTDAFIN